MIAELSASALGALIVHSDDCLPVDYTCDCFLYGCHKCLYVVAFQDIVAPIVQAIELALLAKMVTVAWMFLLITVSMTAQLIKLALIA